MKIDFVIAYVDGNDHEWQEEKKKYYTDEYDSISDSSDKRFRDWGTLKYWFRGVDKFAPWVHKVFLITYGHYPEWMNLEYDKLEIVKHEDYIPSKWLPTFSSHTIELNMHRIEGLSEHFVYFNDDMFLIRKVEPDFFFRRGLPRDSAILRMWPSIDMNGSQPFIMPLFDVDVINKNFNKYKSVFTHLDKWISPYYGMEILSNLFLIPTNRFTGFSERHLMNSFLKSTFTEVWEKESDILEKTCSNRFRTVVDVNQYLIRYWQLASGNFYPRSCDIGRSRKISRDNMGEIKSFFHNSKYKAICLNDDDMSNEEFEELQGEITSLFEEILPDKSNFEK